MKKIEGDSPDADGSPTGKDVIKIRNDVFIDCGQVFGIESSGPASIQNSE